ncbi:SMI1 / KNR4 family (SUKH-1) [Paenibacillus algorifonticola]|uniref:SMI1 / KNR4 family (SUKH-1) n=1 Tax=Paenibacillus algorifonticola TaxID=684063 RepID=A0A1I2I507_9BACL|nr:SMI1/KNR4 family protein [Paenibacillus algorifonticola]SFF35996.1 SMI1 / KNR4 family (SUKH-1) [Paenibacillus algorifonticola]
MAKMEGSHESLTVEKIELFELEHGIKFTELYKKFIQDFNGGYPVPNMFKVSDEQGEGVLNLFYGIGDMYSNLEDYLDIYEDRLPNGFIPIGNDPGGNVICLGINKEFYETIYFWDHEEEYDEPDMSNMYFLANSIYEFLDQLYEDSQE